MALGSSRGLVRTQTEDKVVRLVNVERAKRRLGPLHIDERLRSAARWHSADMARRGFFAHQATRGPSPFERMLAAGFEDPGGENIAAGQESPASVVHAWMQSIPHRANILNADFRFIGVGLHIDATGPWWTQNFGF
ncbi:Cysteine-rich secretory protein family protein [Saccharopolyspora shandongensis]|uniref:Cysteine-rich secretory protein family protein n=1 Tax=Saccharopolyspora shandongensis TaxID=418495 RepID=A0A1H3ISM0_9PSEU|nr:CAP domain-containing protein [Saccharopolyspora shandongensis]SDY30681.1 Cysteine-rich secretory protein family protein [Saccharopolyspora shandongensis]